MHEVTLRPGQGIKALKAIIAFGDLMFLALPWLTRSFSFGAVFGVAMVLVSLVCAAALTFFGWLGTQMRAEVAPDAVRLYYFRPMPSIIPRETIADVCVTGSGRYSPALVLIDGTTAAFPMLTRNTRAQAEMEADRLRAALREVAPAAR